MGDLEDRNNSREGEPVPTGHPLASPVSYAYNRPLRYNIGILATLMMSEVRPFAPAPSYDLVLLPSIMSPLGAPAPLPFLISNNSGNYVSNGFPPPSSSFFLTTLFSGRNFHLLLDIIDFFLWSGLVTGAVIWFLSRGFGGTGSLQNTFKGTLYASTALALCGGIPYIGWLAASLTLYPLTRMIASTHRLNGLLSFFIAFLSLLTTGALASVLLSLVFSV